MMVLAMLEKTRRYTQKVILIKILTCKTFTPNNQKERGNLMDVKNKAGDILGTYELTVMTKAGTYEVKCTDKQGNKLSLVKEISSADGWKLASQQFNTNVRNYIAGLARPSRPSKLKAFEAYFAEKGIDVIGIDTDKLIAKLKDLV